MKRVRTTIRIFSISLSTLILIILSSFVGLYFFFPKDQALKIILDTVEKQVDRKITANGFEYSLSGIILNDINIYDSQEKLILLSVKSATLTFSLEKILKNQLELKSLNLIEPEFIIDYSNDKYNFEDLLKSEKAKKQKNKKTDIEINFPKIYITDAKIVVKNTGELYKPLIGTYKISAYIDRINSKNISINNIHLMLPEKRGIVTGNSKVLIPKDGFKIISNLTTEKLEIRWAYDFSESKEIQNLPFSYFKGNVKNLEIDKSKVSGNVEGDITLIDNKIAKSNGSFAVDIDKMALSINNISSKIAKDIIEIENINVNLNTGALFLKINKFDADVSMLRYFIELPNELYGRAKGQCSYSLGVPGILNLNATVYNAGWDLKNRVITGLNTNISIRNNEFKLEDVKIKAYDNPSTVSIATIGKKLDNFVIFVYLNNINIKKQIDSNDNKPQKRKSKYIFSRDIILPIKVSGKVYIDSITYDKFKLGNTFISYNAEKSTINLNQIVSHYDETEITGKGSILLKRNEPIAKGNLSFNGLKIQKILRNIEKYRNRFFGPVSGNANISIDLNKGLESLKGNAEINIDNGKVVNTGIQNSIGRILEPLKYKLSDLEFNRIYGNISITGNNYAINSIVFNSEDFRLSMNGNVNNKLDGLIDITVEFNENFIKDLPNPSFLFFKKYKVGMWYTVPIRGKGELTKPENFKQLK